MTNNISRIAELGVLVKLTPTSVYSPASRLEEMAADYAARTGIDRRQLRGSKKLLPDELFSPLREMMKTIVSYLDTNTSLWEDGGWRIAQSARLAEIDDALSVLASRFHRQRDIILSNWDEVEYDMRTRLGVAFDPRRFPTSERVREHLTIEVNYKTVPSRGDWRTDVPQRIIDTAEETVRKQYAEQQKRVRGKVVTAIRNLQDKCVEYEDGKSRIHQSTLDEVVGLIDVIPGLLLEEDSSLLAICAEARNTMRGIDREILKDNATVRKDVAEQADELLRKLGFYDA